MVRVVLRALFVVALAVQAASAQDAPSEPSADLASATFADGTRLTSYGRIDLGWLNYDDGGAQRDFAPVSNDIDPTRAGFLIEHPLDAGGSLNARAELQYMPNATNEVTFSDPTPDDFALERTDIRHLEVWRAGGIGTFWAGQGSMATDSITEIDLSRTDVAAYSSIPDVGGAFKFRQTDGILSSVAVKDAYSNLDGNRQMRLRYDTPTMAGLVLSAAAGRDVLDEDDDNTYYDAALRWNRETGALTLASGIGVNWVEAPAGEDSSRYVSGSVSALHRATGLNATLAGGTNIGADGDFWYGKLGLIRSPFKVGPTAVSVDYGYGNRFAGQDGQFDSWSVAAVQTWDRAGLDLFAVYRLQGFGADGASYDDGRLWFAGARWRF